MENRFRGRHNFSLSDTGVQQAQSLKEEFSKIEFTAVYSSPLKRALDTARIINPSNSEIQIDEEITNISLGSWENQLKSEISKKHPHLWKTWLTQPEDLEFEGMETLRMVQKRSYRFVEKLIQHHANGNILVVSHRAVLKPLFARMLGIAKNYFWKIELDTASYSVAEFRKNRGFTFTCINQNKHLQEYIREDLG
jgi:broad specificity phosphatase PhoE